MRMWRENCHCHSHLLLQPRHSPEICFRNEAALHPQELCTRDHKRHVRLSLNCSFLSLRSLRQGCRLPPPEEGGDWVHPAAKPRLHLTKQKHKLDVWQTNLISEKLKSRPLWLLKMMDANIMFSLSNCCFGGYPIPIKTAAPKHYCIMLPFWNKWLWNQQGSQKPLHKPIWGAGVLWVLVSFCSLLQVPHKCQIMEGGRLSFVCLDYPPLFKVQEWSAAPLNWILFWWPFFKWNANVCIWNDFPLFKKKSIKTEKTERN